MTAFKIPELHHTESRKLLEGAPWVLGSEICTNSSHLHQKWRLLSNGFPFHFGWSSGSIFSMNSHLVSTFFGVGSSDKTPQKKLKNGPCLLFGFEHGIGRGFTEEFRDTLADTGDVNHAGPVGGWWLPSGEKKATSEWKGGKKRLNELQTGKNLTSMYQWK